MESNCTRKVKLNTIYMIGNYTYMVRSTQSLLYDKILILVMSHFTERLFSTFFLGIIYQCKTCTIFPVTFHQ